MCASLNERKKIKTEPIRLIRQKLEASLELLNWDWQEAIFPPHNCSPRQTTHEASVVTLSVVRSSQQRQNASTAIKFCCQNFSIRSSKIQMERFDTNTKDQACKTCCKTCCRLFLRATHLCWSVWPFEFLSCGGLLLNTKKVCARYSAGFTYLLCHTIQSTQGRSPA